MAVYKRGNTWSYEFIFAGQPVRQSAKSRSKTLAKAAEQKRRRELEEGFNNEAIGDAKTARSNAERCRRRIS